jgi:cytochrome c-type biogenesis protein CcmH/NrfG
VTKKTKNPQEIEAAIAALKDDLVAVRDAQAARKWDELARLVKRAGVLDDALIWVRSRTTKSGREASNRG